MSFLWGKQLKITCLPFDTRMLLGGDFKAVAFSINSSSLSPPGELGFSGLLLSIC
jgi:hypothetical protein